jgi:TP901 family phage tail tape measure protein
MPDYVVSTAFRGKDFISKTFKGMGRQAKLFGNTADKSFKKASRSATSFQTITKGILAAGAVQRGLGLLQQGVGNVTTQFISFDDAITAATARFKDIGPEAKNFNQQMAILRARARLAGATTEQTATQAALALDFLARAGFTSTEAMAGLNSMINLATASGEDFATVADYSSDLLGAFFGTIEDGAEKMRQLNRLNDVLVKSANSANVTIEDQFETMKIVAPMARKYGDTLEQVAAQTAMLGNSGIKGTLASTALKNAYTRLVKPTKDVMQGLSALGLTQKDLIDDTGKMKGLTNVLAMITDRIDKLGFKGKAPELGIFASIFGLRATAGAATLADSVKQIREFETMLINAGGTSQKTADRMRQSLGNQIKILGSTATDFGFKFLAAFEGDIRKGITAAIGFFREFDVKPIIRGVRMVSWVFMDLYKVIKPFLPIMPYLIGYMIAYNMTLKAFIALQIISKFFLFVRAIQAATVAQGLFNTMMMLNPIGLVVGGIVALIAALVLLVKHWDLVKEALRVAFDFYAPMVKKIISITKPLIWLPLLIIKAWVKVFKFFKENPISEIAGKVSKLFGKSNELDIRAPNNTEVEAQKQGIDFRGLLNIAGAPEGSTVEHKTTGAKPIRMELLGQNG